jgi:hypothetical protein
MKTPAKNTDLRHVVTDLSEKDRINAVREGKLQKAIRELGTNWLLHPKYVGKYQPELHKRVAR